MLFFSIDKRTSETLRDKLEISNISVHVPKHIKPQIFEEFGFYLAGLIDGDGHFSKTPQLIISFNELDVSLAYFLKKKIGFGNVYKVKSKKAVNLIIGKLDGLVFVLELIKNKIKSVNKIKQINENILSHPYFKDFSPFVLNTDMNLKNYWLAGFTDADGSFQIKTLIRLNRKNKFEVRLNFQIDQKNKYLLTLIQNFVGGNIGFRKKQNTYYYGSTSFGPAKKVINYFDNFQLISTKYIQYLKWRKVYILIQNKKHLTSVGVKKILKLKHEKEMLLITN